MNVGEDYTMLVNTLTLDGSGWESVFEAVMPAVHTLYVCSNNLDDILSRPRVAIVGSRRVTPYGKAVTTQLAGELARQGVVIVSALAYGVDAIAHQAALDNGGITVAILPSSLQKIYPTAHTALARRMVEQGGALISEYPAGSDIAYKSQFVERNRIVSGISDALLITEAVVNSGTMHTARFALEQGRDVLAVPGNITSPNSVGTNNLIRAGAVPITSANDVLAVLGLQPQLARPAVHGDSEHEQLILDLLSSDIHDGNELLSRAALPVEQFNQALTMMEITGKVKALGANQWSIR